MAPGIEKDTSEYIYRNVDQKHVCRICILFICAAHGRRSDLPLIVLNDEDVSRVFAAHC